ncbi:MAG TPA: sigma-70 family RNA polymerase sigma factor [Candidatus Limiplasma sp.]|nr:sigma-70 family RNA polymerase sigma factor [Candidatus Limiplasma sp.]HRX09363.1 sigma-70 family RNA polymerase sigma factor [Candidatus Limiplasma sp.]
MGDERDLWLEEMMARWEVSLLRMCYAYLRDTALAEDAVQETFLKAWKGYDCFRGEATDKTWLLRIAVNTCKDLRKSAWFRHTDRGAALPEGQEPFTPTDDALTRAVMALRPKLREVVLLRYYQDLTGEEIAQTLGIARATVYNRLNRAQVLLQTEWEAWQHEA